MPILATLPGYRLDSPGSLPDLDEYGADVNSAQAAQLQALAASVGVTLVTLSQVGGGPIGRPPQPAAEVQSTPWIVLPVDTGIFQEEDRLPRIKREGSRCTLVQPYVNFPLGPNQQYTYEVGIEGFTPVSFLYNNAYRIGAGVVSLMTADDYTPLCTEQNNMNAMVVNVREIVTGNDAPGILVALYCGFGYGGAIAEWHTDDEFPTDYSAVQAAVTPQRSASVSQGVI